MSYIQIEGNVSEKQFKRIVRAYIKAFSSLAVYFGAKYDKSTVYGEISRISKEVRLPEGKLLGTIGIVLETPRTRTVIEDMIELKKSRSLSGEFSRLADELRILSYQQWLSCRKPPEPDVKEQAGHVKENLQNEKPISQEQLVGRKREGLTMGEKKSSNSEAVAFTLSPQGTQLSYSKPSKRITDEGKNFENAAIDKAIDVLRKGKGIFIARDVIEYLSSNPIFSELSPRQLASKVNRRLVLTKSENFPWDYDNVSGEGSFVIYGL